MTRSFVRRTAVIAVAAGLAAAPACGDTVTMRDGTVHQGTIVENTPRAITLRTVIANIPTTLELPKSQVRDYSVEEATRIDQRRPQAEPERRAEPEAAPPAVMKRDGVPLVLEIPLVGTFGEDIYPKSVAVALDWAAEHRVSDVVFRVNSPGGEVWAAQRIVEIMDRHADELRYHALVERGISASIWPVFACSTITMPPGATLGGAVVYSTASGSAEVDLKLNSILSAELSARAERNGHSGAVVRAMMLSSAELYAWRPRGTEDPWRLTDTRHDAYFRAPEREIETIDTSASILTLTSDRAGWLGVATPADDGTLGALAASVSFDDYDDAGPFGTEASGEWTETCSSLRKEISLTVREILLDYGRAGETKSISTAISALSSARQGLNTLQRLHRQAQDLEMDPVLAEYDELDHDHLVGEINKRLADLRRARRGG